MKIHKKLISVLAATSILISALPVMANATVTIDGTLKPGYTLTALCEGADSYAWYRVASDGTETLIDGATEATYTLVNADGTNKIKVVASKDGEELASILTEDIAAGFGPTSGRDSNVLAQNGDNKYKFTIAETGEKFILLDTTAGADGKFFVLANKSYGSHKFDSSGKTASASQKFDPADTTNIAYWLNNDFVANGNPVTDAEGTVTAENKMSAVILEKDENGEYKYLDADHEWLTEAGKADGACPNDYIVKSALAFLSRQEFLQYKDKFGYKDGSGDNWWLRTGRASGKIDVFVGSSTYKGTFSNYAYNSGPVRPVFYLNDEFFKNVKLDLANTGSEVISVIKNNYTSNELDIYTDEELAEYFNYEDIQISAFSYQDEDGTILKSINEADDVIKVNAKFMSVKEDTTVYMISILYSSKGTMKMIKIEKANAKAGETTPPITIELNMEGETIESGDYVSTFFWKDMKGMYSFADDFVLAE